MAKKLIGIRLEEELLSLKPVDVSISDWLRECIHTWKEHANFTNKNRYGVK